MIHITPSSIGIDNLRRRLCFQFSLSIEDLEKLIPSNIEFKLSGKTKRLRFLYLEEKLWGMIRPHDGFFLFTPNSAKFLIKTIKSPKLRVIIQSDVSQFIQEGRNVFAKHVIDCDPNLIPYSEIIVVNEEDDPLAIGKALLNREEMLSFNDGVAVKVRKGI